MYLEAYVSDRIFDPQRIAKSIMTDAGDLACTSGLGKAAIQDDVRVRNPETQERLREFVDVINKVERRFDRRWWRMVGFFQNFCQAFPYTLRR